MNKLLSRKIIPKIINFIDDKEIIVLHGPRQAGKTSVLNYLIDNYLKAKGEDNIFYFDLEDFALLELCNDEVDGVIDYLKAKGVDFSSKIYLLIDEVQYLRNPSSFLKLFHDRYNYKVKLIVSGSSSFLIRRKFKDSLVGRIIDFELFPLDFEEFLEFKEKKIELTLRMPSVIENELRNLYEEFVLFGGYPAIVLEDSIQKKEIKLKQIINTYIKRDIKDLVEIREPDKFNNLLRLLSSQVASLLNITELSNTLRLAKKTVEDYIFLLENTYIIKRVRPFYRNIRSELTKMSKIFFEDTGLMNILVNKSFSMKMTWELLENSIYSQLRKNIEVEHLYFWRTNTNQEIDFVVDCITRNREARLVPIEVKSHFLNRYTTHLRYFKNNYDIKKGYFCCLVKDENCRCNDIEVIYPWQIFKYLVTNALSSLN